MNRNLNCAVVPCTFAEIKSMARNMGTIPKTIKNGAFVITEQIGSGSYGDVFKAKFREQEVAVKFELTKAKNLLSKEIEIYRILGEVTGYPKLVDAGEESGYRFLVLQLLGPSLKKLREDRRRAFTLQEVCRIGTKLIDCLEVLHQNKYVHCDLKPANVAVGLHNEEDIYLIDFGLAKKMEASSIENVTCGTYRFMSVDAHSGSISYKDDIESLAYMLADLILGRLPWDDGIIACHQLNITEPSLILHVVLEAKLTKYKELLCTVPAPISKFLAASKSIKSAEMPDYKGLKAILG